MKKMLKAVLLLCYLTPFVFLAMNEDVTKGTLWFYLVMIVGFGTLSYLSAKTKNCLIVIIGNVLSFISSCIFAYSFQTEKWEYYFKPFLPNELIIFESVIAFIVQLVIVFSLINKHKDGENV